MIPVANKINPLHARRRARRAALQALYQWQLAGENLREIEHQFRVEQDLSRVDVDYFSELLHQVPAHLDELDQEITPLADRPVAAIDPIERAILRIGIYELKFGLDIPYRVVLDEAIQLAKHFGATESYKYVNGLLDQAARTLRAVECRAGR